MKGLLKNNFYGVIENLKIALAFVMLVGVLLLITGEATLLSAFSLIAPPIIALLVRCRSTLQPVRSNGGASTAATAHTGPCRRTSTPSVRRRDFPRWQWTAD